MTQDPLLRDLNRKFADQIRLNLTDALDLCRVCKIPDDDALLALSGALLVVFMSMMHTMIPNLTPFELSRVVEAQFKHLISQEKGERSEH